MRYLLALTLIAALAVPGYAYDHRLPNSGDYTDVDLICDGPIADDETPSTEDMLVAPFTWTIWRTSRASDDGQTTASAWISGTSFSQSMDSRYKDANTNHSITSSGNVDDPPRATTRSYLDASGDGGHFKDIVMEYSLEE